MEDVHVGGWGNNGDDLQRAVPGRTDEQRGRTVEAAAGRLKVREDSAGVAHGVERFVSGDVVLICTLRPGDRHWTIAVSYTHLRAHETRHDLVCRLLLEKKKNTQRNELCKH